MWNENRTRPFNHVPILIWTRRPGSAENAVTQGILTTIEKIFFLGIFNDEHAIKIQIKNMIAHNCYRSFHIIDYGS